MIDNNELLKFFSAISNDPIINYNSPNWIDFEKELKSIIKIIDDCYSKDNDGHDIFRFLDPPNWRDGKPIGEVSKLKFYYFIRSFYILFLDQYEYKNWKYEENAIKYMSDKKKIISEIYDSFIEFCKLFELYCFECLEKTNLPNKFSFSKLYKNSLNTDSETLLNSIENNLPGVLPLWGFDSVLSFNYTDTYRRIYVEDWYLSYKVTGFDYIQQNKPDVCFVHGKAGDGNIIIGIDEYLDNEKRNSDFDFIEFKKYYQRIDKKTGSTYRDWLKTPETKNVYYIGHSFAETDYDILREFLMNDDVKNTILYHIPERKKELIQRVINIIGQEELIKRVHGADWTIRFEPQEEFLFSEKNTVFVNSLKGCERQLVTQ